MLGKISLPENIRSSPRTGYCKVICVVGGRSNTRDYVSSVEIYEPVKTNGRFWIMWIKNYLVQCQLCWLVKCTCLEVCNLNDFNSTVLNHVSTFNDSINNALSSVEVYDVDKNSWSFVSPLLKPSYWMCSGVV